MLLATAARRIGAIRHASCIRSRALCWHGSSPLPAARRMPTISISTTRSMSSMATSNCHGSTPITTSAACCQSMSATPRRPGLRGADVHAEYLPAAVGVHADRDNLRHPDDPPVPADLQEARVDPQTGPIAFERAIEFAFENALKGLSISSKQIATERQRIANALKTHDLIQVACDCGFILSNEEDAVLGALSEIGRWAGQTPGHARVF